MFTIIIQILTFQLCFLVAYELLFKKETFFNWNRAYLLITSVASLVLPFIKLKSFSKVIPSEYMVVLPTVVLGETNQSNSNLIQHLNVVTIDGNSGFSIQSLWYIGVLFFTGILLFKLFKIIRYRKSNTAVRLHGYSIITLKNSEEAFSFLNTIFLGDSLESSQKESILKHEKVHVKEKHTLDLLWFELLRIVLWFNPLVYMYQKRITEVHEFIADKSASKQQQNYYENLLAKTFNIAQFSVVNQFYSSSLIKKRIIMLTKEKSSKISKLKYLVVAPVIAGMLLFTSCENQEVSTPERSNSVIENIQLLKESIAVKGSLSKEEEQELKLLLKLISNSELKKGYSDNVFEGESVSFVEIDQAPVFPGCGENVTLEELKKCFSKSISQHVNNNFNVDLANSLGLKGKQKIYVAFKIDKEGLIKELRARAPHEKLKAEAIRVLSVLPVLKPGIHNGKPVSVLYSLPIIFEVN